jgi:putative nucleotide binding protein
MYRRNNNRFEKPQNKEEYAIVLDVVLDNNRSFKDNEVAQAIGTKGFNLLELVPKQGVLLKNNQKVYIGDGKRDEIQYIKRSLKYEQLSGTAQSELQFILVEIIKEREEEFISFFNNAGPITIRKHSLELIPGIGKKHLKELLEERDKGPFTSFEDLKERCSFFTEPEKALAERIIFEQKNEEDIKLFVRK